MAFPTRRVTSCRVTLNPAKSATLPVFPVFAPSVTTTFVSGSRSLSECRGKLAYGCWCSSLRRLSTTVIADTHHAHTLTNRPSCLGFINVASAFVNRPEDGGYVVLVLRFASVSRIDRRALSRWLLVVIPLRITLRYCYPTTSRPVWFSIVSHDLAALDIDSFAI